MMPVERPTRLAVDTFDPASLEDHARLTPDMLPEAARRPVILKTMPALGC